MPITIARSLPVRAGTSVVAVALAALALGGCSKKSNTLIPDLPPTVRLTHAPVSSTSREVYAYRMDWVGYDPDGRVDHFLYAVDPKDADHPDTSWTSTTLNEKVIYFSASVPDEPVDPKKTTASEFHVFAIKAVDNQGMMSETVERAFYAYTVAPIVKIQNPVPGQDGQQVTPAVRISWGGIDPDGITGKPVEYKFKLFPRHNPDFPAISDFIQYATSPLTVNQFRHLYAPAFGPSDSCPSCSWWDSFPSDTNEVQYTDLVPSQNYLFVVTGIDDAGAYDPIWTVNKNMLILKVTFAGQLGPIITMYNDFFNYTYPTGGYANDPSRYVDIEVPADQLVTINWYADPGKQGASMAGYRWVMDLLELDDETARTGPNDWYHWSPYGLNTLSATVGPFDPAVKPTHLFFIEAKDNNGLRSLGIVRLLVVRPTFDKDLLIVRDLRALQRDQFTKVGGSLVLNPPTGAWPTRAELDTFMFAVGGVPWKGYPAGTLTTPGVFKGYHFDTLGTYSFLTGVVPLATLGQYKYVLWWVDQASSGLTGPPTDQTFGTTALRYMSDRNHPSTISTYIKQGGSVWLSGGGAANATLAPWNKFGSDPSLFTDTDNELVPGRYMYDFPHWQSEIRISSSTVMGANFNVARYGSKTPSRGWTGAPDYSILLNPLPNDATGLLTLDLRSPTYTDESVPPLRSPTDFYVSAVPSEFLNRGDYIRESIDTTGTGPVYSTLDTLYSAFGGAGGNFRPVMTLYHGRQSPSLDRTICLNVFSGFPLWYFRRVEQMQLVDFVLQNVWGLTRDDVSRDPMLARMSAGNAVRLPPRTATPVRPSSTARR